MAKTLPSSTGYFNSAMQSILKKGEKASSDKAKKSTGTKKTNKNK